MKGIDWKNFKGFKGDNYIYIFKFIYSYIHIYIYFFQKDIFKIHIYIHHMLF